MRVVFAATVFIVLGAAVVACETRVDEPEVAVVESSEGWEWLFDGTSLEKWRGYRMDRLPDAWSIRDSVLVCSGTDGGDIITKGQWQNFDLQLEWKIAPEGNSGVFYRAMEIYGAVYETGPEYQLLDNAVLAGQPERLDETTASLFDVYAPSADVSKPAGEWNSTRIVVNGTAVSHWLNGTKVVELELFGEDWNTRIADSKWAENTDFGRMKRGHIGLQDHGSDVWFRSIKIKKLPDTVE